MPDIAVFLSHAGLSCPALIRSGGKEGLTFVHPPKPTFLRGRPDGSFSWETRRMLWDNGGCRAIAQFMCLTLAAHCSTMGGRLALQKDTGL